MIKGNVCVMSFTDPASDPRVNRHIRTLRAAYAVCVVGLGPSGIGGALERVIPYKSMNILRRMSRLVLPLIHRYEQFYWNNPLMVVAEKVLREVQCDVILTNDVVTLPLALRIAKERGWKVILDAHEYAPLEFEDRYMWNLLISPYMDYLCRTYLSGADRMMSVSQGIAERYQATYGKPCTVLMNVPYYTPASFHPTLPNRIRLIHHGAAMPDRNLESLIETLALTKPAFELHFMLMQSNTRYFNRLKKLAETKAPGRVFFHPTVPLAEIVSTINQYDIGIHLLPAHNFNNANALPNKFFEFMMAGLAVAIGPSPAMARIVTDYRCGVVSGDFRPQTMAQTLNELTPEQIDRMKHQALQAAKVFNYEREREQLKMIVTELLRD